jgi:protein gp37
LQITLANPQPPGRGRPQSTTAQCPSSVVSLIGNRPEAPRDRKRYAPVQDAPVNDTPTDRVAHDSPAVAVRPSPTPPLPRQNDLFHARVPISFIRDIFDVCRDTPHHTYQVLTKRSLRLLRMAEKLDWPSNLWMGISVENAAALHRVDHLRKVPAAVRFLSCEPLIGPLDAINLRGIDWVIAGGESGPNYRPMDINWARGIRDACTEADVAFFFKQWGGRTPKALGRELDGQLWDEMPATA